jgi:hypothetical protein
MHLGNQSSQTGPGPGAALVAERVGCDGAPGERLPVRLGFAGGMDVASVLMAATGRIGGATGTTLVYGFSSIAGAKISL